MRDSIYCLLLLVSLLHITEGSTWSKRQVEPQVEPGLVEPGLDETISCIPLLQSQEKYTSGDIDAFCNWWETGGREARDAMKATEAMRSKLYSSCATNLIDNWNVTEVCRSMTKKLRRAEGGSSDIDTTEDSQIRGNLSGGVGSTTPMTEIIDTDDESAEAISSISIAQCSVVCHFPLMIAAMCSTKWMSYLV